MNHSNLLSMVFFIFSLATIAQQSDMGSGSEPVEMQVTRHLDSIAVASGMVHVLELLVELLLDYEKVFELSDQHKPLGAVAAKVFQREFYFWEAVDNMRYQLVPQELFGFNLGLAWLLIERQKVGEDDNILPQEFSLSEVEKFDLDDIENFNVSMETVAEARMERLSLDFKEYSRARVLALVILRRLKRSIVDVYEGIYLANIKVIEQSIQDRLPKPRRHLSALELLEKNRSMGFSLREYEIYQRLAQIKLLFLGYSARRGRFFNEILGRQLGTLWQAEFMRLYYLDDENKTKEFAEATAEFLAKADSASSQSKNYGKKIADGFVASLPPFENINKRRLVGQWIVETMEWSDGEIHSHAPLSKRWLYGDDVRAGIPFKSKHFMAAVSESGILIAMGIEGNKNRPFDNEANLRAWSSVLCDNLENLENPKHRDTVRSLFFRSNIDPLALPIWRPVFIPR